MADKAAKSERLYELEIIRTVSFLAVVFQHVLGAYARRQNVEHWQNVCIGMIFVLSKFAVPAFLFVSGVVLFRKYFGKLRYFEFLKKRLSSIVLPYVIWSVFYFLYQWYRRGEMPVKREFLTNIMTGDVSYHTWYVILILQFYVFIPLIFWIFGKLKLIAKGKWSTVTVFAGCAILYCILLLTAPMIKDIPVLGKLFYRLQTRNFVFYLIYFMLGGVCALNRDKFLVIIHRLRWYLTAMFAVSYAAIVWWLFEYHYEGGVINLNAVGSMDLLMFVLTAVSILLLYGICAVLGSCKKLSTICNWVGKHSYTAYLAHAMVIGEISILLLENFPDMMYPGFYGILIPSSVVGSLVIAWLFDLTYNCVRRIYKGDKK